MILQSPLERSGQRLAQSRSPPKIISTDGRNAAAGGGIARRFGAASRTLERDNMKRSVAFAFAAAAVLTTSAAPPPIAYSVLIRGGTIYDGSGGAPYVGDVALRDDKIAYVGPHAPGTAARIIDVSGKAVSPGFINVLSWANESLIADGRGMSDLKQGVTLEIFGEGDSGGPLNERMKKETVAQQGDIKYEVTWSTLGEYLDTLVRRGVSPNVASFVGATTVRNYVIGE